MKVRHGFVSNSSSCSYIVLLPDGFAFDDQAIKDAIDKNFGDVEDELPIVKEAFDALRSGKDIWNEEYNGCVTQVLHDLFTNKGLVLAGVDTGPDAGQMISVSAVKVQKILDKTKDAIK